LRHHTHDLNDAALAKAVERLERANRELRGPEEQSALC
jgi:predicted metal-dependent hydrolase